MQKPIIISCIILSSLILMDNASAFQRSLCYENLEPEGLRLKVKFLSDKPYRPNAEILREEYEIRTNPDISGFIEELHELPEKWYTPAAAWPVRSISVEITKRHELKCLLIYSSNSIFAQYSDLNGFVMQPISPNRYRRLSKSIMNVVAKVELIQ